MYLRSLSLANFRNYRSLDLHLEQGTTILTGRNGQGKSGIIEAIYLLATTKSHRTARDLELISIGSEFARVAGIVERQERDDVTVEVVMQRAAVKSVKVNGSRQSKISDAIGQLNAVVFSTADIEMVKGEPTLRRRFMDLEISQVSPQYVFALGRYKRTLEQRNSLLKSIRDGVGDQSQLALWDDQIAQYGAVVMHKRSSYIRTISALASEIYSSMTDSAEQLAISYRPHAGGECSEEAEVQEMLRNALRNRRELDLIRGTTSTGPHRDDILIEVNGIAAREYGSQGQQRTAAAALKLAEVEAVKEAAGEDPVVLLDDVMAELDDPRRTSILNLIRDRQQVVIATTDVNEIGQGVPESAVVREVKAGEVSGIG
jgi:DNA replication and repair protein RecF